ncbi:GNAT family N-acetyltransferase [Tabrizicola oligotrophica]|uniref:GNAT family N-acetyltransferase n=1 Tax=Tabrizicola oligotrophica TaxID=2710650 RepID=A0A6M0QXT3_9RHOB|nr:GNAT family N-acetyltransferase [Tabrizicola oligotrophica]NEY92275.1 GNAT family N-acetyltransferase [Tabrizicola oligotrophica]
MSVDPAILAEVMEATWPPAARQACGPFMLRDGRGGGKRVSAATVEGPWTAGDLVRAEAAMDAPLFLIRAGDEVLDAALAERGYRSIDPVTAYAAPVDALAGDGPARMTTFPHWPPMQIARALWADAGIGPARLAVMERAEGAKAVILGRANDRASGVAFVACHGRHAMLHALEVIPALRRQGSAQNILRAAAIWAKGEGADTLSVVVTVANAPARALYAAMGMVEVGAYHYRQR